MTATWILAMAFAGCAHRVRVLSDPAGAEVTAGGKVVGYTPLEVETRWVPFRPDTLRIARAGHRTAVVHLDDDTGPIRILGEALTLRWGRLTGAVPRRTHEVMLIPRHGRAGTWTPEDATGQ